MPSRMDPLLQETIIASIAMTCLGVLVALLMALRPTLALGFERVGEAFGARAR